MYALRVIEKLLPSRKLKLTNKFVFVPNDLQIIKIGSKNNPLFLTGLHIPDNIHPDVKSQKFLQRKRMVEDWIRKKTETLKIPVDQHISWHNILFAYKYL